MQRGRVHAGRAGLRVAQVRAPDPLPGQAQPQRAADLPQPLRPGHVRERAAGVGAGGGGGRRDGLFRVRPGDAPAAGGVGGVPDGARAGHGHRAVVLSATARLQHRREELPRRGRSDGAGQPPRGHDRGGHHQAEAGRAGRRVPRGRVRAHARQGLFQPGPGRTPDRDDALPGGQLLHGPGRADQLGRLQRRQRLRAGGAHGSDQQAGRRHGADFGAQGVPAPDGGRGQAAEPDPGCVPG